MQYKKFITCGLFICFAGIFLCSFGGNGIPIKTNCTPTGGSTSFAPNTNGGWNVLFSYIHEETPGNIEFELILKQATSRIGGRNEKLVGTITDPSFLPKKNQKISYTLLPGNAWYLVIKKNGDCYLAQVKGSGIMPSNLAGNPDVIPLKVKYKRK